MSEDKMNRRSFLQASTLLGVGSVVGASALLSACNGGNKLVPLKQPGEFYVPELPDKAIDGKDTSWIWDANFNSLSCFENKVYVSSTRFDDMALRLKYANVNPSLIVMEGSIKNAIQCCYWELEKDETMLILATPSLIDEIYDILKK